MPVDHSRINDFINQRQTRSNVADVLKRAGFEVVWVDSLRQEVWGFFLKLNRPLRQLLGTAREVLVWVAEYDEYLALTVMQATKVIEDHNPRLSEDFVIIITGDPNTEKYVNETAQNSKIHFIGFSTKEFHSFEPRGTKKFLPVLQQRFFTKDLYYLSTAITRPSSFYGRKSLINELMASVRSGSAHVGLFGLRKMGKTSVLLRIIEGLQSSGEVYAHIDIQRIDAIQPSTEYLLWSIGEQLIDSRTFPRGVIPQLTLFGKYRTFSEIPDSRSIVELFDHDLRIVAQKTKKQIVLLFDEIEHMSPEAPGSDWGDSYVRVWRLLRGANQQMEGKLSFFVTGTNPRCIEVNRLEGKENPTYNYFTRYFLSPLASQEAEELLSQIGTKIGLRWTPEAIEQMMRFVGGHPFLLRAMASKIHRSLLPRAEVIEVTRETVTGQLDEFLLEYNSSISQMIEVLDDFYPDEYMLLNTLAVGKIGEFRELSLAFPDDIAHLIGYGLIERDSFRAGLKVELLQTWLQRRIRQRELTKDSEAKQHLEIGAQSEGFEIEALINRKGGFGEVFRARRILSGKPEIVALKVLRSGSLAALQREVDALSTINHPNVVKIYDYGRFASGQLYIAMEHLEGHTGRYYCDRASRLSSQDCLSFLSCMTNALITIHPDESKIDAYRQKQDLTLQELGLLEQARHGLIHRDIKPENVIFTERGPVLIDFGISARVGSAVKTVSATPGYLPPDGLNVVWDPDIDLYQLGLTALQMAMGIEYDGDNLQDLHLMAAEELSPNLHRILMKLTDPVRDNRYSSARALQKALPSY